jgi:alginate O-acetyltransferase complex protein AlgI
MLYPFTFYPLYLISLLAIYWTAPARYRRYILSAGSLSLITFMSWRATLAFLVLAVAVYLIGQSLMLRNRTGRSRTALLTLGIALPLLYLATFKYLPEYSPPIQTLLSLMASGELLLPLGISYFTFKFVHYVIEARRGTLPPHDWWDFLAYSSLFSIFAAGPIERFTNLQPQLGAPAFDSSEFAYGLQRIFYGTLKKVLLADVLIDALLEHVSVARETPSAAPLRSQVIFIWARWLYLYFDFSGYSDIAIGTSRLFGLRVIENFNWPILRKNVSEFWRSWHISLSSWCRDYIYFPVLGSTRNPKLAVYASMLVLGYWHGANPKWICWGAWHASGLAMWQVWQTFKRTRPTLQRLSRESLTYRIAATALTLNYVVLGSVWSHSESMGQALQFLYYMVVP